MKVEDLIDVEAQERAANGDARFEPNVFLERIEKMANEDPKQFALMSPGLRTSVGFYSSAKRRAAMMKDAV
jgi:hypothetical protein